MLRKNIIVTWHVCVVGSWMNVKPLHFKRNKAKHHHVTPHTSGRGRGPVGPDGPDRTSTHFPKASPPVSNPSTMACVPSPLTRLTHINRRLFSSASHFSSAAPRANISPQKAQQQAENEMNPSITTEANQPFPARSTVAQRKQANELRKVRKREKLHSCLFKWKCFLIWLFECSLITYINNFF